MAEAVEVSFTDVLKKHLNWDSLSKENKEALQEISKTAKQGFAPTGGGFFSHEAMNSILEKAARDLSDHLKTRSNVDPQDIRQAWQQIVVSFFRQNYWDHKTQSKKPPRIVTEESKRRWELWTYIWALIQSSILMKLVIYYFGIKSADDDEYTPYLLIMMAISWGSLFFFAWRKHRKDKKENPTEEF